MEISKLTLLGFYINGAQGRGENRNISIETVKKHLEEGDIFKFLKEKISIDVSILHEEDKDLLNAEWYDMAENVNESRKFCVDEGGLCLLMAYILESIQRLVRKD